MLNDAKAALIALVILLASVGKADAQGAIRGCVTDQERVPIGPGWILVSRGSLAAGGPLPARVERRVATDAKGCYEVAGLDAGTYTVRAAWPGFCDGVREGVVVRAGGVEATDFSLRIAPLDAGVTLYEWRGWAEAAARADLIVHLRIEEVLEQGAWPSGSCGSEVGTEYRARALAAIEAPRSSARLRTSLRVFLESSFGFLYEDAAAPKRGDEFVALLQWDSENQRFTTGELSLMVPIRGGKVAWPHGSDRSINGRRVQDLLATLRRYARR